jgi:hypothetical protein
MMMPFFFVLAETKIINKITLLTPWCDRRRATPQPEHMRSRWCPGFAGRRRSDGDKTLASVERECRLLKKVTPRAPTKTINAEAG